MRLNKTQYQIDIQNKLLESNSHKINLKVKKLDALNQRGRLLILSYLVDIIHQ